MLMIRRVVRSRWMDGACRCRDVCLACCCGDEVAPIDENGASVAYLEARYFCCTHCHSESCIAVCVYLSLPERPESSEGDALSPAWLPILPACLLALSPLALTPLAITQVQVSITGNSSTAVPYAQSARSLPPSLNPFPCKNRPGTMREVSWAARAQAARAKLASTYADRSSVRRRNICTLRYTALYCTGPLCPARWLGCSFGALLMQRGRAGKAV